MNKMLAILHFHTANFHTPQPPSEGFFSRGRKSGDPVTQGCAYWSCSKCSQVKFRFANSKKLVKKLSRIETSSLSPTVCQLLMTDSQLTDGVTDYNGATDRTVDSISD